MDIKTTGTEYHIVRLNRESGQIEYLEVASYNGNVNSAPEMIKGYKDGSAVNKLIHGLNEFYKSREMNYICYRIVVSNNSTHQISTLEQGDIDAITSIVNNVPADEPEVIEEA